MRPIVITSLFALSVLVAACSTDSGSPTSGSSDGSGEDGDGDDGDGTSGGSTGGSEDGNDSDGTSDSGSSGDTDDGDSSGGGPPDESSWEIDDQLGNETGYLRLTNGLFDFDFNYHQHENNPFWMEVTARNDASYFVETIFNNKIGTNNVGGAMFETVPGGVTDHTIGDENPATRVIELNFGNPRDDGGPSRLLGPVKVTVTVRWNDDRVDIQFQRPILIDFTNHNGFNGLILYPDDHPFTFRMGVESTATTWTIVQPSMPAAEAINGYFLDADGMLGRYENELVVPGDTTTWKDYLVLERSGHATFVYAPDFRNLGVPVRYDQDRYYLNSIRPFGPGAFMSYAQTGMGWDLFWGAVPQGDYDEHIRLLLGRPVPDDPVEYDDWLAEVE